MKHLIYIFLACFFTATLLNAEDAPPIDVPPLLPDLPADVSPSDSSSSSGASTSSKSSNTSAQASKSDGLKNEALSSTAPSTSTNAPTDSGRSSSTEEPALPDLPDLPDIPSTPSSPSAPSSTPSQMPSNSQKPPSSKGAGATSTIPEASPIPKPTNVEPQPSQEIGGRPVPDPAEELMHTFKWEALFSSRPWIEDWWMPQLGIMRVTTLRYPLVAPRGGVINWQRDSLGNPMVYLRARVPFPRLRAPDPFSQAEPFETAQVIISQAVVFYARPDGWLACGSPLYVTMEEKGKTFLLVPVERGQGVWRAMVGHGGIHIENFIGAGLQAARTEINQYFRDEEIRLFMQNNGDVVFYLRPVGFPIGM